MPEQAGPSLVFSRQIPTQSDFSFHRDVSLEFQTRQEISHKLREQVWWSTCPIQSSSTRDQRFEDLSRGARSPRHFDESATLLTFSTLPCGSGEFAKLFVISDVLVGNGQKESFGGELTQNLRQLVEACADMQDEAGLL